MSGMPRCHDCGKFCKPAAWKLVFSGAIPMPDREIYKCRRCLNANGPPKPDPRVRPECSCGVFAEADK